MLQIKIILFLIMIALLSNCASSTIVSNLPNEAALPDLGLAPELSSNTWVNTESPLRLADLRGKVILLNMWTFG